MYTLVTLPGTCSTGIHVLLNILDIKAEVVHRDKVPNYQQIVPTNQVPALINGDLVLTEGSAIVLYLLDKHQITFTSEKEKNTFNQWLMFNYATLHPAYSKLFTTASVMTDSEEKTVYLRQLAENVARLWQIIDNRLAQQQYLTGNSVTVIDYLLAIYANWGNYFPELTIPLGDNVKNLVADLTQHKVFVDAFEQEGASFNLPKGA
ncbi:glutathione S-transferase family protein [Thalassotalea hakodatensis]|uniref:glutathione S-transferase family protein n=1 Tax=Thalassotalea hakodatensis TaxID=3030492 RepID=UPI002572CE8E|nr:glutathione S-transferase family protein [Thalassotalea hakodatensis]